MSAQDISLMLKLICVGCNKKPSELDEYIEAGRAEDLTPEEFVIEEEGTLNHANGHFMCTTCYIEAGQPLGVAP